MTAQQINKLQTSLKELMDASADAELQDANMQKAEDEVNAKQAPFNNDARIAREGEHITREADAVMQGQSLALTAAKAARDRQFHVAQDAHLRLDKAANEYKNAGIEALQTGAIEKV